MKLDPRHLTNVADPGSPEILTAMDFEATMFDRRAYHSPLVEGADGKRHRYDPKARTWKQTRGITLHQTACDMGERIERYDTIGAHFAVLRSGRVLWMADMDRVVVHGHGWNAQCCGVEVNGLYPGLEDDPDTAQDESLRTTWDDPSTPTREKPMQVTPVAMQRLRQLIRWIWVQCAINGGKLEVLCSHRQSSVNRRNDPGQAIWRQAAVPLMAELDLTDGGPGFKIGNGYPNPAQWDPSRRGFEY